MQLNFLFLPALFAVAKTMVLFHRVSLGILYQRQLIGALWLGFAGLIHGSTTDMKDAGL